MINEFQNGIRTGELAGSLPDKPQQTYCLQARWTWGVSEKENHISALKLAHKSLKNDGKLYIGVYEGDKSGIGKQTGKDSYQRNEKLESYLPTIQKVFPNAKIHKGIIHATK